MPSDFRLIEARQPPLKDQYDGWPARVIRYAFSPPATPFAREAQQILVITKICRHFSEKP